MQIVKVMDIISSKYIKANEIFWKTDQHRIPDGLTDLFNNFGRNACNPYRS